MPAQKPVSEEVFCELLQNKLREVGEEVWDRALRMFKEYGASLSWDVTNVLMHAHDQGKEKVEAVLLELEKFFNEVLQFQYPGIRGQITFADNRCSHERMFLNICTRVLNLDSA